jgi:hypothetical protein
MQRRIRLYIITLFCLSALVAVPLLGHASGPQMVIDEKHFDFKEVNEGSVVAHSFSVRNTGDEPLRIRKVRPG